MKVIRPLISNEIFHLRSTVLIEMKKKTEAAIIAIVPMKKVNPV